MSWWKRLFGLSDTPAAPTAPEWSEFTDPAAFDTFIRALEAALEQRGVPRQASIRADGSAVAPGPGGADRELLFWNLSADCAESPPETWPRKIKAELDAFFGGGGSLALEAARGAAAGATGGAAGRGSAGAGAARGTGTGGTTGGPGAGRRAPSRAARGGSRGRMPGGPPGGGVRRDAESAAPRPPPPPPPELAPLRLQVFGSAYVSVLKLPDFVHLPLADGIVAMLVRDLGTGETTVSQGEARAWGKSDRELLTLGRQLAAAKMADQVSVQQIPTDHGVLDILVSNGFFLGAYVLELFEHLPPDAVVFFVPLTWHHWILHIVTPETPPEVVPALHSLAQRIGKGVEVTNAEWIGEDVYGWSRKTGFLPVKIEGGEVEIPKALGFS